MSNIESIKALPIQQKAFAITANMTFPEYLEQLPQEMRQFMQMRRAEVRLSPEQQDYLLNYADILNFVMLVSDEAPETAIILPIIARFVANSPRFSLHVLRDTDELSMLDAAVDELELEEDDTELDLPLLLLFDEEWNYQAQWGSQPEAAEAYLDEWLERHPTYEELADSDDTDDQDQYWQLTDTLLFEMRMWYNSKLDKECIAEICQLLAKLSEEDLEEV